MQLSEKDIKLMKILSRVDEFGSLSKACAASDIVPSTGMKLVNALEKEYGIEFVESHPFEGSQLTVSGNRMLKRLRKAERYLNRQNKKIY